MKQLTILLFTSIFSIGALGQTITAPIGFKLVKADGVNRHVNHYVKENITFMSDGWTGPLPADVKKFDAGVAQFLSENYRTSLSKDVHFSNGVYFGTAHYNENYIFTVLDGEIVYKISSKQKDASFEKYSKWLLSEAYKHHK